MEHIQHLTLKWLGTPGREVTRPLPPAPPELPDRDRIHRVARLHHKQLLIARRRTGSHHDVLRAQTEALRQFTLELTAEQAQTFMNMYIEESSAVERAWLARTNTYRAKEPLNPTLVNVLTFAVTLLAIAAAIYFAV